MRKYRLPATALLLCIAMLSGRAVRAGDSAPTLRIGVPQAPPALPVLHMIDSGALGDGARIEIDVWSAPEQLIAMVQDGGHQLFAFPLTVAAKLHNKGVGIKLTNVNTWGVTYFVTSDPDVDAWTDLEGKTLFVPLKSSPPDALTRFFLGRAGLQPGKDVEIVYSTLPEIAQLLKSGSIANAVLLEPHVTAAVMGNPALRVAMSFETEWRKIKGAGKMLPTAGFGATTAFLDANPELARAFEREYEKSTAWILAHPAEAGALGEKYLGLRADALADALPRLGLHYKAAAQAAEEVEELFRVLLDFSPDMIGKKIPDETLYWR